DRRAGSRGARPGEDIVTSGQNPRPEPTPRTDETGSPSPATDHGRADSPIDAPRPGETPGTTEPTEIEVDVLVAGSGGGGLTAALKAEAEGLSVLIVEKGAGYGGSTALSGGGIWVPNAPAQRRDGYCLDPDAVVEYLKTITEGTVTEQRLRAYVAKAPEMMEFL